MAGEIVAGMLGHSLALLADAGHMLTDAAALGFALVASAMAARPAVGRWTFGYSRLEILAPQANGITLGLLALWVVWSGAGLLRDSTVIFLERAPSDADPDAIGRALVAEQDVVEVHDLHVWTVTSGFRSEEHTS